jgi:hypothetical protein
LTLLIQEIFLVGKEVRKIPTLHSQFFYFEGIENYDYQITDVIRI